MDFGRRLRHGCGARWIGDAWRRDDGAYFGIDVAFFGERLVGLLRVHLAVEVFGEGPFALFFCLRGAIGGFGCELFSLGREGEGVDGLGDRDGDGRGFGGAGCAAGRTGGAVHAGDLGAGELESVEGAAGDLLVNGAREDAADDVGDDGEDGGAVVEHGDVDVGGGGTGVAAVASVEEAERVAAEGGAGAAVSAGADVAAGLLLGEFGHVGSWVWLGQVRGGQVRTCRLKKLVAGLVWFWDFVGLTS
jgi:hypothetical protein